MAFYNFVRRIPPYAAGAMGDALLRPHPAGQEDFYGPARVNRAQLFAMGGPVIWKYQDALASGIYGIITGTTINKPLIDNGG